MIARITIALVALAAPGVARAADTAAPPSIIPSLLQTTLGLAVVLALIWGAARLARRFSPAASSSRSPIKLVASQALGQRERVVLVELGEQWLLLGVAPGNVNMLHAGPKSTLPQPSGTDPTPFSRLLAVAKRRD